jgi:hypothetical protein
MRRVVLLMLRVFVVGLVMLGVIVLRRRSQDRSEPLKPGESLRNADVPGAVGHQVGRLSEADMTPYDELREEGRELRHGAVHHLSNEPLAPKMV